MKIDIITIFPDLFTSFLNESLIKKAQEKRLLTISVHDLRNFTFGVHRQVDDRPFGGGPGMVLMVEPIYRALRSIQKQSTQKPYVVLLTPTGTFFSQSLAQDFSSMDHIVFIAGRYEGVDERVSQFTDTRLSIGPYIVSGGELPTMVVIEALSRYVPGVLGNKLSLKNDIPRDQKQFDGVISSEYPVYTRPEIFLTDDHTELRPPPVLLSGDHQAIDDWRRKHARGFLR